MSYIIKASETHPMQGAEFELFQIRLGPDRKWMRDDEKGKRWGFLHPDSGEVVHIWPAGTGPVPNVGQITNAFTVIETVDEERPNIMDLSVGAEMGRPELTENEPDEEVPSRLSGWSAGDTEED